MAICPKCHSELPYVGACCPHDGWYGVDPDELERNDKMLGYPIGGEFVALRRVGQGGMGVVYEGRQIGLDRVVAIKLLSKVQQANEQVAQRFQREARSIARIVHPNVVKLIDSGFDADVAYIVMEFVIGRELSSLPASELSGQLIVHIAHQILNALAEAHARNVIHRDLKPDNIMITVEGDEKYLVKVLDFGLAALTDATKITISGQALGTPWYMSPEQATASPVTTMTDIYSLGCILYELASGKPPFSGNRPFNVMMQHVNAAVPPLVLRPEVELSNEMISFIYRCLQKQPEDRFLSALDALDALHKCPEWVAASQLDPMHSISLVMKQLSEMSDVHSEISKVVRADSIVPDSGSVSIRITRSSIDNVSASKDSAPAEIIRPGSLVQEPNDPEDSPKRRSYPSPSTISRPSVDALVMSFETRQQHAGHEKGEDRAHSGAYSRPSFEKIGGFEPATTPPSVRANLVKQKIAEQNKKFRLIMLVLGVIFALLLIAIIIVILRT